jgi:superfamily II DNA or RNA helicase
MLTQKGYHINKNNLTTQQKTEIKEELTASPKTMGFAPESDDINYKLYTKTSESYIVPRYYGISKFGSPKITNFFPTKSEMKFKGDVRDYQIPIIKTCYNHMLKHGGGLLSVPCGRGKTVMAIKLAVMLGLKTLIIVHKSFLQDQWIDRINKFSTGKVGSIRRSKIDVEGKDFVVAMIQSLCKRDYDDSIFAEFGLVICDESHHFSSKQFSKALAKSGAKYTLALSATPYRNDGLINIMHWYLGEIMYQEKTQPNPNVVSKIISFKSSNEQLFSEKKRYFNGQLRVDCVKMISNILKIEERNNHLINIINELRKINDRKILILSGRKDHLKLLKNGVDNLINQDVKNKIILKDECKTYYYTGDLKQNERIEAERNADVFFATYEMASEALDIERLNCVVFATPKKDVNQSTGRILRKILEEGDLRPLVIDFLDKLSIFNTQGLTRAKFFKSSKYQNQYYYLYDDKICSQKEYLKLSGSSDNKPNTTITEPKNYCEMLDTPLVENFNPLTNIENIIECEKEPTVYLKPKKWGSLGIDLSVFD